MVTNNSCDYSPTQYNVQTGGALGTLNNVAPSATSGVPVISQGSASQPVFGTAVVAGGGTGDTSFTAYAPVCGGTTTTGSLQSASTGIGTANFVLTSTGATSLPTFQNVSASGAVTSITGDTGTITGSALTIKAGISTKNCGSSVSFTGSSSTLEMNVTDSNTNTSIGDGAGSNYNGTETNNILLGTPGGYASETNAIHIGSSTYSENVSYITVVGATAIIALSSTPVTVVASPGASLLNFVTAVIVTRAGTHLGGSGALSVTVGTGQTVSGSSTLLTDSSNTVAETFGPTGSVFDYNSAAMLNSPIKITTTALPSGGDSTSTLRIIIKYTTISG